MHVLQLWRYPVKSMAGERLEQSEVGVSGLRGDRGWAVREEATGAILNAKRHPKLMQCAAVYRDEPTDGVIPPVDVTFPDGEVVSSDAAKMGERLSELLGKRVTLEALRPASDRAFYRRRDPGSSVIGAAARSKTVRRLLGWAANKGLAGGPVRQEFGREDGESLPDFGDVPAEVFEYYTPPGTFFDVHPIHVLTTGALQLMAKLNPGADWDVRRFRPNVLVESASDEAAQVESDWVGRDVRIGGFTIRGELMTMRCAMPMHAQRELRQDPSVLRTIVRDANQCLGLYASVRDAGSVRVGEAVSLYK